MRLRSLIACITSCFTPKPAPIPEPDYGFPDAADRYVLVFTSPPPADAIQRASFVVRVGRNKVAHVEKHREGPQNIEASPPVTAACNFLVTR